MTKGNGTLQNCCLYFFHCVSFHTLESTGENERRFCDNEIEKKAG